jgi:aspartyl-tRNA synthetase
MQGPTIMSASYRTHACGQVTENAIDQTVTLSGWVNRRRDHGGIIFIDLRDRTGLVQLVFDPSVCSEEIMAQAHKLRAEFVIKAEGKVIARDEAMINPKLATGKIEIDVTALTILNSAKPLPFQLDEADNVDEELRLQYRYLDLRREKMHNFMKLRHEVVYAMREALNGDGFYEIETPVLSKSTPEGARDFLVPSRLQPGTFYALPQSPQVYKQLLMASGFEKYFQIARCFRDEDLRANRQPEFSQLDIEMSFVEENDVYAMVENMMGHVFKKVFNIDTPVQFDRMPYEQAIATYGIDKPDRRFELHINDITPLFVDTELSFLKSVANGGGKIGALCVKEYQFSRSELEKLVSKTIKDFGAKGLLYIRFNEDGSSDSPVSKFLAPDFFAKAQQQIPGLTTKDTLFIIAGEYAPSWTSLGRLRLHLGKELNLIDENKLDLLWVTRFPLLEWDADDKRYYAMHHPFTAPEEGWQDKDPAQLTARAYDLVCNGEELGGGSIRIHESAMQEHVFKLLGIDKEAAHDKFGFLLESQELGFPPLGGIALGLDRLIMLMTKAPSIREVIAFPKMQSGMCPLMQTPCAVEDQQLRDVYVQTKLPASLREKSA